LFAGTFLVTLRSPEFHSPKLLAVFKGKLVDVLATERNGIPIKYAVKYAVKSV